MKVSTPSSIEWKKQRLVEWEELDYSMRSNDSKEMLEILAARKIWFVEGDLKPLANCGSSLKRDSALSLYNVMWLCPTTDKLEYIEFMKEYSIRLSTEKLDYWGRDFDVRDQRCIERFLSHFYGSYIYSSEEIHAYFLDALMPDSNGTSIFPFKLGGDEWQPSWKVAVPNLVFNLLGRLSRYLFKEENESKHYSHLKLALPFIEKNITTLDPKYYDTEILDEPYITSYGEELNFASQELMRGFLGKLNGYKTEFEEYEGNLRHNDKITEAQLRSIFENTEMPKEYGKLIQFIHEHKENCVNP
jgi:hypothetical protein